MGELNGMLPFFNPEIIMRSFKLLVFVSLLSACARAYPVKDSGDTGVAHTGDTDTADEDGDGHPASTDCDDSDPAVNPAATEVCNGVDDDCSGRADDDLPRTIFHLDADTDGYGDPATSVDSCESTFSGHVSDATDCNDADPAVNPAATEVCNGVDDDCDGYGDEYAVDPIVWYRDTDSDGYGLDTVSSCTQPSGYVTIGGDCDDADPAVNPLSIEICDGLDNDCDGSVDGDDAIGTPTWYGDGDSDGYGDPTVSIVTCDQPAGYVANATDCDDWHAEQNPGVSEYCNGVDDNCDGVVPVEEIDSDGDGYNGCTAATDCDDADALVNPGAAEYCNGYDDDCDGDQDEDSSVDAGVWFVDADVDGYGESGTGRVGCEAYAGESSIDGDCIDWDPTTYPLAPERCDGVDNDCDGSVDDGAPGGPDWFLDADGDGFGNDNQSQQDCEQPPGYILDNTDCDDTSAVAYPGGIEMCDGVDNDCDGQRDEDDAGDVAIWYADSDADGYGDAGSSRVACAADAGESSDASDCDDGDDGISPGATEIAGDGIDQDCDGADAVVLDPDVDGDGYPSSIDCNDGDDGINSGATDVDNDGVDNDCNGSVVDYLCVEPSIGSRDWEIYLDNQMSSSDDATWGAALATGAGTLCVSVALNDGDEWKVQGRYADGTWLVTNSGSLIVEATAMGIPFVTTPRSWGGGSDAFGTVTVN